MEELEATLSAGLAPFVQSVLEFGSGSSSSAATEFFGSDQEYLETVEAALVLRAQLLDCQVGIREKLVQEGKSLADQRAAAKGLESLLDVLDAKIDKRLRLTQELAGTVVDLDLTESPADGADPREPIQFAVKVPRLVRLCQKLELSKKESLAVHFLVLHHCGTKFPISGAVSNYVSRGMLRNLAQFSGMNSKEILDFLSPNRLHMKDALFSVQEDPLSFEFAEQRFTMTKPVLSAVLGASLTDEELLSIANTKLAEVLQEEGVSLDPSLALPGSSKKGDLSAEDEELLKELEDDTDPTDERPDVSKSTSGQISESFTATEDGKLKPFIDDLDYLNDYFEVIANRLEIFTLNVENSGQEYRMESKTTDQKLRELKAKEKQAFRKCQARLEITTSFVPRVEKLVRDRNLNDFEKWIVLSLIGGIISAKIRKSASRRYSGDDTVLFTIGRLLCIHFDELRDQINHRKAFYKSATLIKENIVKVSERASYVSIDLMDCTVEIDRRMLDYCVALDTELDSLVEGSFIVSPTVTIHQVILPEDLKNLILQVVSEYGHLQSVRKHFKFEESMPNANNGIVLLFHGVSGTGKTMMAHALANYLKRKLLVCTFSEISSTTIDNVKLIFRESKLQNSIVFFDECESLLTNRSTGKFSVNSFLTEIERFDGILVLATNRAYDLDEAMHRRISLAVEFPCPGPTLRRKIWESHIPSSVSVDTAVDFSAISMEFELTGGFIKNAVVSAIAHAAQRCSLEFSGAEFKSPEDMYKGICLNSEDIKRACLVQIRGQAELVSFDRRSFPQRHFNSLVLTKEIEKSCKDIIVFFKSQKYLSSNWGFSGSLGYEPVMSVLLFGPPGTGKRSTAEALAFECGKPMKHISCSEIIAMQKFPTAKQTSFFADLRNAEAFVVIHGLETMLSPSVDPLVHESALSLLLMSMQSLKGVMLFLVQSESSLEELIVRMSSNQRGFLEKMTFMIHFTKPTVSMREKLWRTLLPSGVPRDDSIDFKALAKKYDFVGESIQKSIFRACAFAANRVRTTETSALTMADLEEAAAFTLSNSQDFGNGGMSSRSSMFG